MQNYHCLSSLNTIDVDAGRGTIFVGSDNESLLYTSFDPSFAAS